MCSFVRCAFICGLAIFAGVAFLRLTGGLLFSNVAVVEVPRVGIPAAATLGPTPFVHDSDPWSNNQSMSSTSWLTTPMYQSPFASSWGFLGEPPVNRVLYSTVSFLSIPIVLFAILGMFLVLAVRRRRRPEPGRNAVRPEALANARKQAAIIDRMHGIMDRIETRVERLESALLP